MEHLVEEMVVGFHGMHAAVWICVRASMEAGVGVLGPRRSGSGCKWVRVLKCGAGGADSGQ